MGFWKNLEVELEYMNVSRKELAFSSGVPLSTINKGIQRDSEVTADVAIRISKMLGVSLEHLLGISNSIDDAVVENGSAVMQPSDLLLYHKYKKSILQIENLSPYEQKAIFQLISTLSNGKKNIDISQ